MASLEDIAADREVILAAGAINCPKLLMLSGVGEAKALRSLGIDVVENLPGAGENLQDHALVSGIGFKYKGKMPDRPAGSNAVEAEAYLSSSPLGDTDISLASSTTSGYARSSLALWNSRHESGASFAGNSRLAKF